MKYSKILFFLLCVFVLFQSVEAKERFSYGFEIKYFEPETITGSSDLEYGNMDPIVPAGPTEGCEALFDAQMQEFLQDIFTLIKFFAPTLVLALSTIDYVKAISAQNADEIKKANGRFVKRLVAGIVVFLLPFILDLLFEIFGLYGLDTCGIR